MRWKVVQSILSALKQQKIAIEDVEWVFDICELDLITFSNGLTLQVVVLYREENYVVTFVCLVAFPRRVAVLPWNFVSSARKHCIFKIGKDASICKCLVFFFKRKNIYIEGKIVAPFSVNVGFLSSWREREQLIRQLVKKMVAKDQVMVVSHNFSGLFNLPRKIK